MRKIGDFMCDLTSSLEDYLEALYILKEKNEEIRVTDVAKYMNISKPSVKRAVNTLKEKSLVEQKWYGKITLTKAGIEIGKKVYFRHKILTEFFKNILGVSQKNAEIDACKSEHILSEETISQIIKHTQKNKKNEE